MEEKSINRPKRIAMYVIYDKDGILDGFRKYYLQELRKEVDYIVGVISGPLTPESRKELEALTDDFFVRENVGLLAYSWIDGIAHIGWDTLAEYDELLMLNDSFFGPFYPLKDMFDACEKSDSDFYGAFRNFENENMTEMMGRSFKHGHLRGSICYFYIIKEKLLHSNEFRKYWSAKPEVKKDVDTFFFSEFDFYDYVVDAGFKVDAYQSEKYKNYCFDNLSHNMKRLIEEDHIPFARIRPFGSDMMNQSFQLDHGKDTWKTLEYIDKETDYDSNLIWDYLLRTKNLTDIWNQMKHEYVVSFKGVETPYTYDKKIAVILHIYYEDQVDILADYCKNFGSLADFYITTTEDKKKDTIDKAFAERNLSFECKVRPNVGVAMSTLWITYANITLDGKYDYICYFHDKKSPYWGYEIEGEQFGARCYENLFGSEAVIKNIINLFEENPRLGMMGPPRVYHGRYFNAGLTTWERNYEHVVELAKKMDIHVDIRKNIIPVAPYGDMFWYRADAMKKAIGYGFTYDDFSFEYKPDGTILHAIERLYGFAVQDSGYYYAEVINSENARADLVNYQYMIYQLSDCIYDENSVPYCYEELKNIVVSNKHSGGVRHVPLRILLKRKFKRHVPKHLWKIMRKVYRLLGGKKWAG